VDLLKMSAATVVSNALTIKRGLELLAKGESLGALTFFKV
jgi:hypothetical protein